MGYNLEAALTRLADALIILVQRTTQKVEKDLANR